jgi:hypothetical protein
VRLREIHDGGAQLLAAQPHQCGVLLSVVENAMVLAAASAPAQCKDEAF